ncbi:MAG: hypothetical protein KBA50_09970, partial [Sedimentibacter sp.]|nr:hypothetical protein [Sedimentibacter sp.]
MKIKFFPLIVFLVVNIIIFTAAPQNIKLPLLYITPLIIYTLFITKAVINLRSKEKSDDDMEVNEMAST